MQRLIAAIIMIVALTAAGIAGAEDYPTGTYPYTGPAVLDLTVETVETPSRIAIDGRQFVVETIIYGPTEHSPGECPGDLCGIVAWMGMGVMYHVSDGLHYMAVGVHPVWEDPPATCDDGVLNQDEEGIDCGGGCGPCSGPPTCDDGLHNQDEEGIDCGGPCGPCIAPSGDPCADTAGPLEDGVCATRAAMVAEGRTGIIIGLEAF